MLNKNNFLIADIIDESKNEVLTGLHITKKYTEATDSFCLFRVSANEADIEECPIIFGKPIEPECVIRKSDSKDIVSKFKKNVSLPILENAIPHDEDEETIKFTTTDTNNTDTIIAQKIEGEYPQIDNIIYDKINGITFSVPLLKKMINTLSKMAGEVKLQFGEEKLLFHGETVSGQEIKGMLMGKIK
jgi:hypothetical protein